MKSIMKSLGFVKLRKRQIQDLSGGEQRRLSLALELVSNPKLFIGDEPTVRTHSAVVFWDSLGLCYCCFSSLSSSSSSSYSSSFPVGIRFYDERKDRTYHPKYGQGTEHTMFVVVASTAIVYL
jgi:hypothetical protein